MGQLSQQSYIKRLFIIGKINHYFTGLFYFSSDRVKGNQTFQTQIKTPLPDLCCDIYSCYQFQKVKSDSIIFREFRTQLTNIIGSLPTKREFKYDTRKVSWKTAEEECMKWGGHLLTINSQDENDYFIREMVKRNLLFSMGRFERHERGREFCLGQWKTKFLW